MRRKNLPRNLRGFPFRRLFNEVLEPRILLAANGSDLRTYRFAVAATEEYTGFFGDDRLAAQAEIVAVVDAANVVLNSELNVHLDLIDRLDIIFGGDNPVSPDPFSGAESDPINALDENQALLDSVLGTDGYDIGHVFGTFSGGRATLGGAGVDGPQRIKAKAASGIPVGSGGPTTARLLGIVLHEIGHHLDANHSFNGVVGACVERNAATAYEPGSGTTIMSYAGICPAVFADPPAGDNLQNRPDEYFHAGSLAEIVPHLERLDADGVGSKTTNNAIPVVDAGADFVIPADTPFEITVTGSDADNDPLRYTIEPLDLGPPQTVNPFPGDNGTSPLFRSFPPAPGQDGSFTRTFPQLSDLLNGTTSKGNYLPETSRDLLLRATVRDGVGGTNDDDLTVSVVDTGTPFAVTNPNVTTTLTGGSTETITWVVGDTDLAPINASMVDIRLSIDGGQTFPFSLAVTENDGLHDVVLPNINSAAARIKVAAVGNVFFDLSDVDFALSADSSANGVSVSNDVTVGELGLFAAETDTYTIALNTDPGGTVEVTLRVADSQAEISLDGQSFSSSLTFTRSDTTGQVITVRAKDDSLGEGPHRSTIMHTVSSGTVDYPVGTLINDVAVEIIDDEQPPLIGVDMFFPGGSLGTVPFNWNALDDPISPSLADLIREDGRVTPIDLQLVVTNINSFGGASVTPTPDTLPIHTPSLAGLDDNLRWRNSPSDPMPFANVEAIWSDLDPGSRYAIYVFALESSPDETINQSVTITGAGIDDPAPFIQVSAGKDDTLIVNDQDGDANRTLESFAKVVTADSAGKINVNIRRDDGVTSNRIYLAGLAIQEVPDLQLFDFGDAPTAAQSGFASSYPTSLPNGASHRSSALFLGSSVDTEGDGQPSLDANGDGGDEDGLRILSSAVTTTAVPTVASFLITASAAGKLDAWIDFNRDGDWLDANERLFTNSIDLAAGSNIVSYAVPAGSSVGQTYARIRLSSAGGLEPTGAADDGEVEDYRINILNGDSPVQSSLDLVVGNVEVTADGSDVVFRHDTVELFRAPGASLGGSSFIGTDGDDQLRLGDLTSASTNPIPLIYDGAAGRDALVLIESGQTLDLTDGALNQLANLEVIDIVGASPNSLNLNQQSVIDSTDAGNVLLVIHDDDDTVSYSGNGWLVDSPIYVDGSQRHVLNSGAARIETINALPFQNPLAATDVNFNGETTILDALQVINYLGRFALASVPLAAPNSSAELPERYYDVNRSRTATALDALNVINFLARVSGAAAESPAGEARPASAYDGLEPRAAVAMLSSGDKKADIPQTALDVRDTVWQEFGAARRDNLRLARLTNAANASVDVAFHGRERDNEIEPSVWQLALEELLPEIALAGDGESA